jgi:hypothetical protein
LGEAGAARQNASEADLRERLIEDIKIDAAAALVFGQAT